MNSDELERRRALWSEGHWVVPDGLDVSGFNFDWRPDPYDRPYIHQFGTQWQRSGGPKFVIPESEGIKFRSEQRAVKLPERNKFTILVDYGVEFDWSWHPDELEPPFIWIFGNQFLDSHTMPTVEYRVDSATDIKYVYDVTPRLISNKNYWKIVIPVDESTFDFTWVPHPHEPPYIYTWGNKWNPAEVEPTVEYCVAGATDRKYMGDQVATPKPIVGCWTVPNGADLKTFDFSWRPNPHSPPQIYQWENNGPIFTVPGATEVVLMKHVTAEDKVIPKYYIKTTLEDLVAEHPDEIFWALNPDLTYEGFDFAWQPDQSNFKHINVFGNDLSKDTQTYYVNGPLYQLGHRELNYVEDASIKVNSNLSMFWIDLGSHPERFQQLKERYPELQKTRYLASWVDTINRCIKKTKTKLLWILSSDVDYSSFVFDFYPAKWQTSMIHVFGTQWSHWGNTYLINSETFVEDSKYIKVVEHLPRINHVRSRKAKVTGCKHNILYIDHGYGTPTTLDYLRSTGKQVHTVSYDGSYLRTIKNWINSLTFIPDNYTVWITSSICSYEKFDFSWHPDPFQSEQLHVFASEYAGSRQKFGDTFLLNVSKFKEHLDETYDLQKYENKVNYIQHITVPRLPHPVIEHTLDSQVDAVKGINSEDWLYYELIDRNNCTNKLNPPVISLWDSSRHPIMVAATGASHLVLPSCAIDQISNEVYDYQWIDVVSNPKKSKPLDIVFISNGEPTAEANYSHLLEVAKTRKIPNRIIRVKDVKGRVASQRAAAEASSTNWYFLVNGKLRVNEEFDWGWQPDRLQQPKHYIFKATNPVNGLEYGHQAIVANNRALTLATTAVGLDFTLDSLHSVVDINCGVALYNTDPWTTWRTAFRECVKLSCNRDSTSKDRLVKWLSGASGEYGEWSQLGAKDGVEYYRKCRGKLSKLMTTYDWGWIEEYYLRKYGGTTA